MRQLNVLLSSAVLVVISSIMSAAAPILEPTSFDRIAGWHEADHRQALATFKRSCAEIEASGSAFQRKVVFGGTRRDWLAVCSKLKASADPRRFFEETFTPLIVRDPARPQGLFTGYYEPEAEGSLKPGGDYKVPVYARPDDLVAFDTRAAKKLGLAYGRMVDGAPHGYFTRREIEEGALKGRGLELVWLKDWADAFFIQVQGSGRVRLPNGKLMRLGYAAKTGLPYTAIGGLLVERGILPREDVSMQAIRAWMRKNPKDARALMWENKSFVFFRQVTAEDLKLGPPGAQKVPLTPYHSLAIDRSLWIFGTPVWLDTQAPRGESGTLTPFRSLLVAQDTGTAIKGHARGDVFWGAGEDAALTAGHMKSPGRMIVLLPKPLAKRLLGKQ
ncbi:murein transglycosylase A [Aestuariivirga sp. YIM B02566]|uniref:Murein transglycosylase A n=1 Tax=Taklimakanibacter albus TaxID=2800327 RepID=A0ACC5QWN9_9HYPH|nr:MltA domain-containing protein [Aestuariivirga sp. YIM B02566]MBK1864768.1 murein transglycosylase A [Aestuariivirga sp. YIM B02566]